MTKTTKIDLLLIGLVALLLLSSIAAHGQNGSVVSTYTVLLKSGASTVSPLIDQANVFSVNHAVELQWTGTAPATASIVLTGSMRGGTACTLTGTLTSTSTSNALLTPSGLCDKILATTSWTGGDSTTKLQLNVLGSPLARSNNGLLGTTQGQAVVGIPGGAASDASTIFASSFKTGQPSPCFVIQNTITTAVNSIGAIVEAGGLPDTTGSYAAFAQPGCGLESNIFAGLSGPSGGLGGATTMNAGQINLGLGTLNISQVPSVYGTCINGSAPTVCAVSAPQFPPGADIYIPNGNLGIRGRGRGFGGTKNTTIQVCTALNTPVTGCLAPQTRSWAISAVGITNFAVTSVRLGAVHRKYMTLTVTPNSFNITAISGNGTIATVVLPLVSGQLSGGQTVAIAGVTNAGFNNAAAVVCATAANGGQPAAGCGAGPITVTAGNGCTVTAPCTQFTYTNATNASSSGGTVAIGSNVVPGEYINYHSAVGAANVNDGLWRVCATQANTKNATTGDNNCPVAVPTQTQFAVVGTSADSLPNMHGADSVVCAANCGSFDATLPMVDIGNPLTLGGGSQFAERVEQLSLDCNNVPNCSNLRNLTGNEQSGAAYLTGNNSQMIGIESRSNINQNSFDWHSIEILASAGNTCYPGTTGFAMADNGIRNLWGWTSNFSGCPNPVTSVSASESGNDVTLVAGSAWNSSLYFVGPPAVSITVTGCSVGGYNITALITSRSGVNMHYTDPTSALGAATGCIVQITGSASSVITGMYDDANSNSTIGTGHTEGAEFGYICGANSPCSSQNFTGVGGYPSLPGNITDGPYQGNPPLGLAAHAFSGTFPRQLNGANSIFTGDYCDFGAKKSGTAGLGINTVVDDYFGYTSTDPQIGVNCVDTAGDGSFPVHIISSASTPMIVQGFGTAQYCVNPGGASGTATPAACGSATSGKIAIPTSGGATYTVNTTGITATNQIFLRPITDPSAAINGATCTTTANFPAVDQFTRTAGTSFTINGLANPAAVTCFEFWILN